MKTEKNIAGDTKVLLPFLLFSPQLPLYVLSSSHKYRKDEYEPVVWPGSLFEDM